MKYFHLYIKTDCPFCKNAVDLLEKREKGFIVTVLDKAMPELVDAIKTTYKHQTVPVVVEVDGNQCRLVGGYTELKTELDKPEEVDYVPVENISEEEKEIEDLIWRNHGQGD